MYQHDVLQFMGKFDYLCTMLNTDLHEVKSLLAPDDLPLFDVVILVTPCLLNLYDLSSLWHDTILFDENLCKIVSIVTQLARRGWSETY